MRIPSKIYSPEFSCMCYLRNAQSLSQSVIHLDLEITIKCIFICNNNTNKIDQNEKMMIITYYPFLLSKLLTAVICGYGAPTSYILYSRRFTTYLHTLKLSTTLLALQVLDQKWKERLKVWIYQLTQRHKGGDINRA